MEPQVLHTAYTYVLPSYLNEIISMKYISMRRENWNVFFVWSLPLFVYRNFEALHVWINITFLQVVDTS